MKTIYVLLQIGQGVLGFNEEKEPMIQRYNEESENGRFAGYELRELTVPECIFNMNYTDFWIYLRKIFFNGKKIA